MNIYILVDLEGVSGVVDLNNQATPGSLYYEDARNYLMSDVNAVIEGLREFNIKRIVIYDMHYYGLNLKLDVFDKNVEIICGRPKVVAPENGLDNTFSGLIMVGAHSMAETKGGLLTHTYTDKIKSIYINGLRVGEIGLEAMLSGESGVPMIMLVGDSEACKEAQKIMPKIKVVIVKKVLDSKGAICYPLKLTSKLIKEATRESIQRIKKITPFKVKKPVELRISYYDSEFADRIVKVTGAKKIDKYTIVDTGNELNNLWEKYKPE